MKTAKSILGSTGNKIEDGSDKLFALSDVIDEDNINITAITSHLMFMYESIVGRQVDKINQEITVNELNELKRDLGPLA